MTTVPRKIFVIHLFLLLYKSFDTANLQVTKGKRLFFYFNIASIKMFNLFSSKYHFLQ